MKVLTQETGAIKVAHKALNAALSIVTICSSFSCVIVFIRLIYNIYDDESKGWFEARHLEREGGGLSRDPFL